MKYKVKNRWSAWSRSKKIGIVGTGIVAVSAAVAVAVVQLRADIDGQAHVVASDILFDGTPNVYDPVGEIQCDATITDGALTMNIEGWPGSSCNVVVDVITSGDDVSAVIQDIDYNSVIDVVFLNGECGSAVPHAAVKMKFSIPSDAAGGTYPASAEAGIVAVQQEDYIDANCPRV